MKEKPLASPSFELEIDGQELDTEMKTAVEEIKLEEELNVPAMLTVKLNAYNNHKGKWQGLDLELFKPKGEVKVSLGFNGVEPMMTGEVVAVNAGLDQYATLEVRAYDLMHLLRFAPKQRTFMNVSDSDLASQFAGEAGLAAQVTATATKYNYLLQNNQTNYQFLLQRARRIGYELLVEERTLIFRPPAESKTPEVALDMGQSLESFKTAMKVPTMGSEVEVRGWDMKTKKLISAKAGSHGYQMMNPKKKSGQKWVEDSFGSTKVLIYEPDLMDVSEAEALAKAVYRNYIMEFINGEGRCGGEPKIRAGKTVKILGPDSYEGNYYVVSTVHTLRRGECYTTSFKVKRSDL